MEFVWVVMIASHGHVVLRAFSSLANVDLYLYDHGYRRAKLDTNCYYNEETGSTTTINSLRVCDTYISGRDR